MGGQYSDRCGQEQGTSHGEFQLESASTLRDRNPVRYDDIKKRVLNAQVHVVRIYAVSIAIYSKSVGDGRVLYPIGIKF